MKALPTDQVQATAQAILTFLDSENAHIPGNMIEAMVSGKSLMRALLSGALVLCQPDHPVAPEMPSETEDEKAA